MDTHRFDYLTRSVLWLPSRRGLTAALALAAVGLSDLAEAKKGRNKKRKIKKNAFGCVNVGNACRGNSANCCSGICEGKKPKNGKKDKSKCLAHNVLDCQAGEDGCLESAVRCGFDGACLQTTGRASFCGDLSTGECVPCVKDTDCEPTFGLGAACTLCAGACPETGGRICRSAAACGLLC